MKDVDFDESATVVWQGKPVDGRMNNGSGGDTRHFERMAEALDFFFSDLPAELRPTASINTSGHVYHFADLERIHTQRGRGERAVREEF